MARREYYSQPKCAHEGCAERAIYVFTSRREQTEHYRRQQTHPWRCTRHRAPEEVMSAENHERTQTLVSYETDFGYGRKMHQFWATPENVEAKKGGNGICSGPGFKALAEDFPPGTRITITARVELPASGQKERNTEGDDGER